MNINRKTVDGIDYRWAKRRDGAATESAWVWVGSDGSQLDPTDDEIRDHDTSKHITDR